MPEALHPTGRGHDRAHHGVQSHIKGKNADVEIYADRVERTLARGLSGKKVTAGLFTGGMSLAATGFRSGRARSEMISIKAISSVNTERDGLINTIVRVASASGDMDFRVRHGEARVTKDLLSQLILGTYNAGTAERPQPAPSL